MKKKGFTLIELLAVIIILAIIALIATPIILNVIEDARKSAGKSEASMILSGINNYCATSEMKNQLDGSIDICTDDDGVTIADVSQMVSLGNAEVLEVKYENGKVTKLKVKSNNYEIELQPDGSFTVNGESFTPEDPVDPTPEGKSLISTLLEQVGTKGLVQDETNSNIYYYVGGNDVVTNNHLWYGGHHWRVMEIDNENKTLLLISQQPLTSIQPSSDVWDTQEEYENSYINNWLNNYFYNSLDSSIQNNIKDNTFNVGIYSMRIDSENENLNEITTVQKIGLLDKEQYTRAGGQNSYLDIKDYFWLGNTYISYGVSFVHNVQRDGTLGHSDKTVSYGIRPVIEISDITITEGNGTLTSNYKTAAKSSNTSNVKVGEYINVPYNGSDNVCGTDKKCTFRVVSKDSDSIKVVLNGLLPSTSRYGDTSTITLIHTIYTPLNNFANNISNEYRYTGNKIFYIGDYPSGANYEVVQDETLQASVGLPTVGEIFSGNDIDLSTSGNKTFVDVNAIENSNIYILYWTMNRNNSSYVNYADLNGLLDSYGSLDYNGTPSNIQGVRPVIFLKNNLNFVSGSGTAQSPYEL